MANEAVFSLTIGWARRKNTGPFFPTENEDADKTFGRRKLFTLAELESTFPYRINLSVEEVDDYLRAEDKGHSIIFEARIFLDKKFRLVRGETIVVGLKPEWGPEKKFLLPV